MENIITEADLQEAIIILEMRQAKEKKRLKEEFHATYERLKPATIVKNIFHEAVTSPEIKDNVIHKSIDVALVFLTNRILRRTSHSFVKRTLGTILVLGIKNIVSRNPEIIKKAGTGIVKIVNSIIIKRNRNKENTYSSRL